MSMQIINSLYLPGREVYCSALDPTNRIGYFGVTNAILKVNLDTLQIIAELSTSPNHPITSAIDVTRGYVYFGISTRPNPGKIIKISLSTFQQVGEYVFNVYEFFEAWKDELVFDVSNNIIYAGLNFGIKKIDVNSSTMSNITSPYGTYFLFGFLDVANNKGYFGGTPGMGTIHLMVVRLNPFELIQGVSGDTYGYGAVEFYPPSRSYWFSDHYNPSPHAILNHDTLTLDYSSFTNTEPIRTTLLDGQFLYTGAGSKYNLSNNTLVEYLPLPGAVTTIKKEGDYLYYGRTTWPTAGEIIKVYDATIPPITPTNLTAACVKPSAPTAKFSRDNPSGKAPLTIQFSNATTGTSPMTYLWQFGDGATSTEISPSHQYTQAGTYKVTLRATNSLGESEYSAFVMVFAADIVAPPNATITADDYVVSAGQIVNFMGSAGADSYLWNFGDGQTSSSQNPSHSYAAHGIYTVTLTITKDGVWTSVATCQIVVTAETVALPPVVTSFGASNTSGSAGLTVSFNPVLAGGAVTSYLWDFGDGYTSTGQNPSHQYTQPGIYTVTLTVANQYGFTTSTIQIIVVALTDQIGAPGGTSTLINGKKVGYYIVDSHNHRVLIYERTGGFITWFGGLGNIGGKFNFPTRMTAIGALNLLEKTEIAN